MADNKLPEGKYDVIIIGGGVAGITAGLYTARAQFKTLLVEAGMVTTPVTYVAPPREVTVREPPLSSSESSTRVLRSAGTRPTAMPVSSESARANRSTRRSR